MIKKKKKKRSTVGAWVHINDQNVHSYRFFTILQYKFSTVFQMKNKHEQWMFLIYISTFYKCKK
jgi:nitrate/nitrite transporter NarK